MAKKCQFLICMMTNLRLKMYDEDVDEEVVTSFNGLVLVSRNKNDNSLEKNSFFKETCVYLVIIFESVVYCI